MGKIGVGTWQLGGANVVNGKPTGWGEISENEAIATIEAALTAGLSFFDTADAYGNGQAEIFLGKALRGVPRTNVQICTKFGNRVTGQDFSVQWLNQAVDASLHRLQTDYLDVLLLHSPPDHFDWQNYDPAPFEKLVQVGKIRAYGVSSKSVYGAKQVVEAHFGTWIEAVYNCLDRRAESILFELPQFANYQFIARVPLASGFLNKKYLHSDPVFRTDEYRQYMNPEDARWLLESVRKLDFLQTETGGISAAAIRFCLSNPNVAWTVSGARNPVQVQQLAQINGHLAPEIRQKIAEAVPDVPDRWKPK
ncbi:MAG: aldo/keto reductase [Runella slithyformis]|nr:MAG: aldo/keto reductase [Runella slithyformis]TAF93766.1 MAG: aldo/keto reductase [Runella sp.]TAG16443.1 MAG: aldo/keto reductase [Cytophagales bacterium]TAG36419.1 MAG: aldo/keto reductase [Cytophagia bacterium]TAF00435.1 MAG: aldo/keto reductase [Runella slithyformis]